jgi:hypothetical protein
MPESTARSQSPKGLLMIPIGINLYRGVQEMTKQVPVLVAAKNKEKLASRGLLQDIKVIRSPTRLVMPELGYELLPLELTCTPTIFDNTLNDYLYFQVRYEKTNFCE